MSSLALHPALFQPLSLGELLLPNRVVMAPMTRSRAGEGDVATALTAEYYAQRASAGLIISEATQVSPRGKGYIATPGIYSPAQEAGWREVTDAVHAAGGRIFAQLWHVGRVSHTSFQPEGEAPVAPSAIPIQGMTYTSQGPAPFSTPRALDAHEIPGIIAQFEHGAQVAKAAGFDGVEIHGANGYLPDQFLRDGSNHRDDAWGGSITNRARFMLEITDAVVGVWGADRVGLRLSPSGDFNGMSDSDPVATFSYVARELGARKLGYLHLIEPVGLTNHPAAGLSARLKTLFGGHLMLNGGYTGALADAAIREGRADLVSFGSSFLANPDLPRRLRVGAGLNVPDRSTFYGGGAKGYTDYPSL